MLKKSMILIAALAGLALAAAPREPETTVTEAPAPSETADQTPETKNDETIICLPPATGIFFPVIINGQNGDAGLILSGRPAESEPSFRGGLIFSLLGEEYEHCDIYGIHIGWFGNTRNQTGLQIAMVNQAPEGTATGQIGILASGSLATRGLQTGGLVAACTDMAGIQVAGMGAMTRMLRGVQVSGLAALTAEGSGLQIAPFNVSGMILKESELKEAEISPEADGVLTQIGLENLAGKECAFQIGLINQKAGKGFQIGLLNYSQNSPIPYLPLINW